MLQISKLNAWYGASHALQDVTLEVTKGEIVCLIGRNGAGKTTTLKSIMPSGCLRASRRVLDSIQSDRQCVTLARL